MCTKLMDRITGSSLPRHDNASFIDPQKERESSPFETGAGRTGVVETGGEAFTGAGAGGDDCWVVSGNWEGTVITDGNAGWRTETGAMVATMADILSSFLSKSRILLGVCPSDLGFAGRLRATCSMHSTRAFWHLGHVLCRGCGKVPEEHTFGIQLLYLREHTELCAYDLLKLEEARAVCVSVLQRSHANALPDLPSLASMAIVELRGLGDVEESLFAEEGIMGSCMCGEIPIICQDLGTWWRSPGG